MSKNQKENSKEDETTPNQGEQHEGNNDKDKGTNNRRRRQAKDRGEVVRLSRQVVAHIKRKSKDKESVDATLRRLLGLPDKDGKAPALAEYFVLTQPVLSAFLKEEQARGAAVMIAARAKKKKAEAPVRVREVV